MRCLVALSMGDDTRHDFNERLLIIFFEKKSNFE